MENDADEKVRIKKEAEKLTGEKIGALVEALAAKDDSVRYPAFLLLGERSLIGDDVYPYFTVFREKLKSENAYQRSIGLAMCARNAKWDAAGKFDGMLDEYLGCLKDEKPMVVRLCIQNLAWAVPYKKELCKKIAGRLMDMEIGALKETQRGLVRKDILHILRLVRSVRPDPSIDAYIKAAEEGAPAAKR